MRYGDIAKVTTATLVDIAVNHDRDMRRVERNLRLRLYQGRNSAATDLTLIYFDEEG